MWFSTGISFICLQLCFCTPLVFGIDKFETKYKWSFIEYLYDSPEQKQHDIDTGNLIPRRPFIVDVDIYYNKESHENTFFVTTPTFIPGVPASLGTLITDTNNKTLVKPYPSWSWYRNPEKCDGKRIISVFRVTIDECDRMWVIDNGWKGPVMMCPPQLLAFDLKTNKLIINYKIPHEQFHFNASILGSPFVDVISRGDNCKKTFVYITDNIAGAVIVYDQARNTSWRISHPSIFPDPNWAYFNVNGDKFVIMDGILAGSLSPKFSNNLKKFFFHAMSADTEYWIYTKDLQNQSIASNYLQDFPQNVVHGYQGRRGDHSCAEVIDSDGILYFGQITALNIACFNINGVYGQNSSSVDIVAQNEKTLQFPTGMKIKRTPEGKDQLWVVTDRFQKVINDRILNTEINFRILVADIDKLKEGTRCASN